MKPTSMIHSALAKLHGLLAPMKKNTISYKLS